MRSIKLILPVIIFIFILFSPFSWNSLQDQVLAQYRPPAGSSASEGTSSQQAQPAPIQSPAPRMNPAPAPGQAVSPAPPVTETPGVPTAPLPVGSESKAEKAPLLDDNLIRMIISSPPAERYPQAGAVILLREEIAQASEAKGLEFIYHVVAKIFDQNGVSEFETVPFPFDSFYQEVSLEIARTIQPDGRIIETPEKEKTVITPPEFSGLNFDPGIRSLIFSLPDLQPGSIVEYQIRVRNKQPIMGKRWWDSFTFQWVDPVLTSRYLIRVPKQERFLYALRNIRLVPKVREEGEWRLYMWEVNNLEAIALESFMPPASDIAASLLISSLGSWNEVDRWYNALFAPRSVPEDWVKIKASEIIKNLRQEEEIIRALYYFIQGNIRFIPLSLGQGGYGPQSLQETLVNGYGDSEDIAAFFISLLQAVGLKAYPALVSTVSQGEIDPELPSPGQFNHLLVFIPTAKGNIWLDPTRAVIPFGSLPAEVQDRWAFVVDGGGGRLNRTPGLSYEQNLHMTKMNMVVQEDGSASVEETWEERGIWNEYYRSIYLPLKPEERREKILSYMSEKFPKSNVKEIVFSNLEDLEVPFKTVIRYDVKEILGKKDNLLATKSDAEFLISEYSWPSPDKLKNDISFKRGFRRIIELSFTLPDGYKPLSWTRDVSMDDPLVAFKMISSPQDRGFKIFYEFAVKKNRVKKEQYEALYGFIQEAFQRSQGMLVFETKEKKEVIVKTKPETTETSGTPPAKPDTSKASSAEIISAGKDLLSKGKYEQALEFFKKSLEIDPRSGEAHYFMGVAYGYLNQYELANKEFKLARELGYVP